ncbi:BglG family transcription antiterminator [Niallia sp.]|uniref:BglG family transcription antiterminator n=1 Tax=Niallia sp. TaxID=2837523 RepID=UPI0028A287A8|nr:BglG family transcription antiterminator [Niallia sp.]
MKQAYEDKYMKIIQYILDKGITTHNEIAAMMNVSTKTVRKYLEDVQDILMQTNLSLSIKPREGVTIIGEKEEIKQLLNHLNMKPVDSIEDREMFVYSQLLNSNGYVKIQDLADKLHVSRTTMEHTMREVRKTFAKNNLEIISNRNGLKLKANENDRRKLMSNVINYYWGGVRATKKKKQSLKLNIIMSAGTKDFINFNTLDKVADILNNFIEKSGLNVTDYEYQSLAIHLVIAIERIKQDFYIDKPIEEEETLLSSSILLINELEEVFHINIPKYEQEYINIHISAIEKNTLNSKAAANVDVLDLSTQLRSLIIETLDTYHPDQELIKNLIVHLNAAVKRLQLGLNIYNPYTDKIRTTFQRSFEVAVELTGELEKVFKIHLNDDEIAYITLHIQAFFDREPAIVKKVVLVCSSGYGTSKLLEQRLKKTFSKKLMITKVLSLRELQHTDLSEELIISTIPIENSPVPVVVVSPLMTEHDIKLVEEQVGNKFERSYIAFRELIKQELLFFSEDVETMESVLQTISNQLIQLGYARDGVFESALKRENLSSTAMGIFAMPHAEVDYNVQPSISIYINSTGIAWGDEKVHIVFFFALNRTVKDSINEVYAYFNELVSNYSVMKRLVAARDENDIQSLLKEISL